MVPSSSANFTRALRGQPPAALHARPRETSSDKMEANVEKSPLIRFVDELYFKQIPVSVKRKKKEEFPSGLILIDSNCDKAVGVTTESVAVRTVYEQLLTKICRARVKVFLQAMKERDLQKQKKVADVDVSLRDKLKGFVVRNKRQ